MYYDYVFFSFLLHPLRPSCVLTNEHQFHYQNSHFYR